MYTAPTFSLPYKDERLRNQAPTCASTLDPYFQPMSLQLEVWSKLHTVDADGSVTPTEGPWEGHHPLQAPNCKPSLLSKLNWAPDNSSYILTAFLTANMSSRLDTKTVMSSAYAEIITRTLPLKETPRRA